VSRAGRAAAPNTHEVDTHQKLGDCLRIPLLRHNPIVDTTRHAAVHRERGEGAEVWTRIVTSGILELRPPGIGSDVGSRFADRARASAEAELAPTQQVRRSRTQLLGPGAARAECNN